jgi:hypothetical protein
MRNVNFVIHSAEGTQKDWQFAKSKLRIEG